MQERQSEWKIRSSEMFGGGKSGHPKKTEEIRVPGEKLELWVSRGRECPSKSQAYLSKQLDC